MTPRDRQRIQTLATRLAQRLNQFQSGKGVRPSSHMTERMDTAFDVLHDYELLSRDLYRLRAKRGRAEAVDPLITRTEEFMAAISMDLVQLTRSKDKRSWYTIFIENYRRIWSENFALFVFTACTFAGALFLGWNIGRFHDAYVPLIVGQQMMEQVIDHRPWFERLAESPLWGSFSLAYNNIVVCLKIFAFGAIGGLGGLALLLYNGIVIGSLMGYCAAHDFDEKLTEFILSHGFLELTVIVASAFASFLVGRSFYMRPFSNFLEHVAIGAKDGFVVAAGVAPWLILAAFFEGFVSPMPFFSVTFKFAAGVTIGALFWIWTFNPFARRRSTDVLRAEDIVVR